MGGHGPRATGTTERVGKCEAAMHADLEHHQSLIVIKKSKKRRCLKCRVLFVSIGAGNACCGSCAAQNGRASMRAQQRIDFHG